LSNPESHGVEDYLEAIYELQEEGERVVQARISRRLGVTRASVSEQVARLQKMRLVESNAMPGTGATIDPTLQPLKDFVAGETVELVRLLEDVELDTDAMRYFEEHALVPGARITIVDVGPDGTMSLAVGDTKSSLGPKLTDNLWVRPAIRKARAK